MLGVITIRYTDIMLAWCLSFCASAAVCSCVVGIASNEPSRRQHLLVLSHLLHNWDTIDYAIHYTLLGGLLRNCKLRIISENLRLKLINWANHSLMEIVVVSIVIRCCHGKHLFTRLLFSCSRQWQPCQSWGLDGVLALWILIQSPATHASQGKE